MKKILTFLSVGCLFILLSFSINSFSCVVVNVSPNQSYLKHFNSQETDYKEDNTIFNFVYNNKVWMYEAEPIKESNQFDLNFDLTKYKSNNKNIKIKLINNLKKLNFNNEIIIKYLFPNLINKLNKINKNIKKQPKNAEMLIKNNKINIKKEIVGINLNFDLLYNNILNEYKKSNNIYIKLPVEYSYPEVGYEDLKQCTNLRASFSTSFNNSKPERKHNINLSAKKINGKILEAGEDFSFNKVVGKRTKDNGYKTAKIIYNGEFIDGVGGGVCQVSSTLYNAALLAGLKIKQSSKHSERISYVKAGFDAMVNYGSSDLIFTNNTNNKIILLAQVKNNTVEVCVYGEDLNGYSYKLRNEITDETECLEEEVLIDEEYKYLDKVEYSDESFYLKPAKSGCTIKSFRDIYSNGNLIKTELLRKDKYLPQRAVKIIGAKPRPIDENL